MLVLLPFLEELLNSFKIFPHFCFLKMNAFMVTAAANTSLLPSTCLFRLHRFGREVLWQRLISSHKLSTHCEG